ncbi:MAG: LLM class flavin-dependent oxidoreductase [Chromatiales bacterium]|nr:LLM class flavin-dependent oxidoreductase [Chromatiales bacterium]
MMTHPLRFGISLPVEHIAEDSIAERFANLLEVARVAEAAGFDTLSAPQHYLGSPSQYLHCIPVLARIAGETATARLCTNIIQLTLMHPVDIAESLATLDIACGGRLVAGFGLGYNEREFSAFGVAPGTRLRRFLEALDLVKRLWTEPCVTHDGEFFKLDGDSIGIRPLQSPRPPVIVAASADKMVARSARISDGLSLAGHTTIQNLSRQAEIYRAALSEQGVTEFPEHYRIGVETFVAKDTDTAWRIAGPHMARKYKSYARMGQDAVLPQDQTFAAQLDDLAKDRFIVGDPETVAEGLAKYRDVLGVNEISVRMHWGGMPHGDLLRAIELFGEHVIPALRS